VLRTAAHAQAAVPTTELGAESRGESPRLSISRAAEIAAFPDRPQLANHEGEAVGTVAALPINRDEGRGRVFTLLQGPGKDAKRCSARHGYTPVDLAAALDSNARYFGERDAEPANAPKSQCSSVD
jgi:hypothetical protein